MATPVITHAKVSGKPQGTDSTRVYGNHWDATHVVTGLENVDNTSDVNKPVSTAQAAADAVVAANAANASNLTSGTVPAARLPNPTASTLGGVQSAAAVSHNWINSISTSGVPVLSQPAAADLSDGNSGTGAVAHVGAPAIVGGTHTAITGLGVRSTGAAFDLKLAATEVLTADRTLTVTLNDAARTVSLAGNLTTAAALTQVGAFATTITATAITNSTLPAGTHTLAGLDVAQNFTALQGIIGTDVPGSGYRFYRGNASDYTEIVKEAGGIGIANADALCFYTNFASAVVAAIDRTGNVQSAAGIASSGATNGIGYSTGAGGAITQATSRSTGVTLNKASGAITLVSATGSATPTTFTVTNSAVAATDVVIVNQKSGTDKYEIFVTAIAAGSFAITFFTTGGATTEQPVFNFAVIKAVAA
jgi:hypothetical protein